MRATTARPDQYPRAPRGLFFQVGAAGVRLYWGQREIETAWVRPGEILGRLHARTPGWILDLADLGLFGGNLLGVTAERMA